MALNQKGIFDTKTSAHFKGIDALRCFACIAIVSWHVLANGHFQFEGFIVNKIIPSWNELVYLFMIISGFGMCNGYYKRVKNNQISIENFYKRRYSKMLPFFSLLIILDVALEHSFEGLAEGFMELTLVFGFLPNNSLNVIGVAWTLGVIFVFYIIFPYFVFLISNKRRAWISFVLSLIIQLLCSVYFMTDKFVANSFTPKHDFLFCVPFFIAGGLIYLYQEFILNLFKNKSAMFFVLCCVVTVIYYFIPHEMANINLNEILILILYSFWVLFSMITTNKLLCNKITNFVSGISMEIYLSHMVCFRFLEKIGFIRILGNSAISYITLVICILIILMIIIPFVQKILNKFIKSMGEKAIN